MNKREFLAVGGAMPLMLAGCGGSGTGSAPVRLLNASVGYESGLGFMVESNQATAGDVVYGAVSPYENVQAGSVGITLTKNVNGTNAAVTASQTRTINKDQRYTLVAYGYENELAPLLVAESNITPDTGKANINVLNTSVDIGAVDVYLSATTDLTVSTRIVAGISGVSQSAFTGMPAGSYYITVVGANTIAQGISDMRFQSPSAVSLTALKTYTIVLTPGGSGVLANAIFVTQGAADAATAPTNFLNTTARVRAVTAVPGMQVSVTGKTAAGVTAPILASSTTQLYSNYVVVGTGTAPTVTVNGNPISVLMDSTDSSGNPTTVTAALVAGGDYTLMVYLDGSGNPLAKVVLDNNTAPVTSSGVKFRLINLASDNQSVLLSMSVNSISVASNVPYATASDYKEISGVPQATVSTASVDAGAKNLVQHVQVMTLPNIFTDIVVSVPASGPVLDFFRSASGT